MDNNYFMQEALKEAEKAFNMDEVPVGAVIVKDKKIIASGHNLRESSKDPTAHAEIIAIRNASKKLGDWRLDNCDLYVTLEPCPMCAGAIIQSRIKNVIWGAKDPKAGCVTSVLKLFDDVKFNHIVCWERSDLATDLGSALLTKFFKNKRKKN